MEKRKWRNWGSRPRFLALAACVFPRCRTGRSTRRRRSGCWISDRVRVNYIDTAYPYHNGQSEPVVGRILKKYDRDSFYLATKLPLWAVNSVEDAERIFHEQLERLQTDHVDFYLLHALNKEKWDQMKQLGVVDYCAKLKEDGKIRYTAFPSMTI